MTDSLIRFETSNSPPIIAGGRKIILQSRALRIRLPFGGFVWNRPSAVLTQTTEGHNYVTMVQDVTRIAQALIFALGFADAIFITLAARKNTH